MAHREVGGIQTDETIVEAVHAHLNSTARLVCLTTHKHNTPRMHAVGWCRLRCWCDAIGLSAAEMGYSRITADFVW